MTGSAERELDGIVHELKASPLRKCTPRAADERVGKDELEALLRGAGLGGPLQGRETARTLACDEKTLRRWRDPLCGRDLAPPDIRIILQGRALTASRFSRTG